MAMVLNPQIKPYREICLKCGKPKANYVIEMPCKCYTGGIPVVKKPIKEVK